MKLEEWKPTKYYEGLYEVSNLGRVKSLSRKRYDSNRNLKERILKHSLNQKGYRQVILVKNGKSKSFKVHRLVAQAFIPTIKDKTYVNHKDCNKENNCFDNLEWCNVLENNTHAIKNGRIDLKERKKFMRKLGLKSKGHKFHKINQYSKTNELIITYENIKIASKMTNIKVGNIYMCLCKRNSSAGGYVWRYVDE